MKQISDFSYNCHHYYLIKTSADYLYFQVEHLRFLEDGQFAKVYKGNLITTQSSFGLGSTHSSYNGQPNGNAINSDTKQIVSIKVPRVSDAIRKEKSMLIMFK